MAGIFPIILGGGAAVADLRREEDRLEAIERGIKIEEIPPAPPPAWGGGSSIAFHTYLT
jgi:hypothetical protein